MGGVVFPIMVGEPGDEDDRRGEDLHIRSKVSRDGRDIDFKVARGNEPFRALPMSFGEACLLYHELRVSLYVAKGRHRMTRELAKEAIADLLRTALQPSAIGFDIDAKTGDTIIVYMFEEHAPFAVRLPQAQLQKAICDLANLTQRRAN